MKNYANFGEALVDAEAPYRLQIIRETFGHLDPTCGTVETGHFTFIKGGYQAVDCQPCGTSFSSGPDFYEVMTSFIFDQCCNGGVWANKPDGLYKWSGELKAFKNGRMQFQKGSLELLHKL